MNSDIDIKRDVEDELRLNPDIDATDIAVAVKNGVITLSGFTRSYAQKWEAERTAKRVAGATGLVNDIEVRLPVFNQRPDPEIAAHIGEVMWVRGQQQEAEKLWRDASRDNPDNELLLSTMKRFLR